MNIFDYTFNLLYPPMCGICGKLGFYICNNCYQKIKKYEIITDNKIIKLKREKEKHKYNLKNKKINMVNYTKIKNNEIFSLYKYEGLIRKLLINYKFNDASYLYNTFLECMLKNKKICNLINSYDIIIPVPLHYKRKIERGYNQTELITNALVRTKTRRYLTKNNKIDILTYSDVLIKTINIKPQSTKGLIDRMTSVKNVYSIKNSYKIFEKNILLFDDIYTTGSTCKECKKVLLKAGAKRVGILTIAKDYLR